jgi:hypothetical protein
VILLLIFIILGYVPVVFLILNFHIIFLLLFIIMGIITIELFNTKLELNKEHYFLSIVVILLWPWFFLFAVLLFFDKNPFNKESKNIFNTNQMKKILKHQKRMSNIGTTENMIPEGFGKFGYEASNPIPVDGFFGSESYLENLRYNGIKIKYKRLGSTKAKNIEMPIDIYSIMNEDGSEITKLYISMYHRANSKIVPAGFELNQEKLF